MNSCDEKAVHAGKEINHTEANQNHLEVKQIQPDLDHFQKNGQKNQDFQGFQKLNNVSNYSLTTLPTTLVGGKVVGSSTQNKNLRDDEAAIARSAVPEAIAPLRGASPQTLESVEEKEELPAVTDCTTLTLVDDVPSQSASLVKKNQDLGDEPRTSHEDHSSAAPVVLNFENPSQPQDQAQQSQSASLAEKNQDLGDEAIAPHEDTVSAVPTVSETSPSTSLSQEPKAHHEGVCAVTSDSNPEKWSYEAVVERSRVRPWRMEKLKMAEQLRENPGNEFLMECWEDDPALRIVIKKLVAKCPQWGLVAADGQLIEWERE
jgi:hypothetical protein